MRQATQQCTTGSLVVGLGAPSARLTELKTQSGMPGMGKRNRNIRTGVAESPAGGVDPWLVVVGEIGFQVLARAGDGQVIVNFLNRNDQTHLVFIT
jgi:hypothetical protein